ncbi:penicillin-binding protein 2 [Orrella sp. 11846]|uniref:penicillin-binding protein 2 n=1 Tax=Orrella sp. 11846 TaxID=3409913 RepID=UPI003B58EAF7
MFDFKSVAQKERSRFLLRAWVASGLVLFALALIGIRLWVLQVDEHEGLLQRADRNRTAVMPIAPRRGEIVDRHGEILARNYLSHTLEVVPAEVQNMDKMLDALGQVIDLSPNAITRFKRRVAAGGRYQEIMLRNDLTELEGAYFAAQAFRFPGVKLKARWVRQYPQGQVAAHVVGYVGRISEADLQALDERGDLGNYRGTDVIGKQGVERAWEAMLHGMTGIESLEVTARGEPMRSLHRIDPEPGRDLILTLDLKLQRVAEQAFAHHRGALVAIDPQNGQILAYVSQPSFDPNLFVGGIDQESWRELNESKDVPMLNRPISGTYPIGSTYKPFVALAALELGKRDAETKIYDPGYFELGNQRFRNAGSAHYGHVDMHRSLVVSSDTYYYSLAPEIGIDALHDFMKPFGFGQRTGIDLSGERAGVLPSIKWKREAFKTPEQQRWYAGETVSAAIGQGYNAFTILQLAQATSVLANGGRYYKPHLVMSAQDRHGQVGRIERKEPDYVLDIEPKHLEIIHAALADVTQSGTARRAFAGTPYQAAGKTGTAQLFNLKGGRYRKDAIDERLRDHSLFMGFAPLEDPSIAIAVLVENGGWGSDTAAPIARKVMDAWLLEKDKEEQEAQEEQEGSDTEQKVAATDQPATQETAR